MRERLALVVGVAVTAVFLAVSFVVPAVVPYQQLQTWLFNETGMVWENLEEPFKALRFFGGLFGGFVTGYLLAGRTAEGAREGTKAAVGGLLVVFSLFILYNLGHATFVSNIFPPPVVYVVVIPFLYLIVQLGFVYVLGGLVGGYVGSWIATT